MTEPRIVDAVEVAQSDHWIGVSVSHGTVHLWSNIPRKSSDELMEGVKRFGVPPQFIVRLPGTAAPAPATATDAVEKRRIKKLEIAVMSMRMILQDVIQWDESRLTRNPWLGQMKHAIKETEGLVHDPR